MAVIQDENSFRESIESLPLERQRLLGARFVRNVVALNDDARLKQALECAERPGASEAELLAAYRTARGIEVESYTACGQNVDWSAMAAHYVASAVAACVAPAATMVAGIDNPAYKAAMSARMARSAEMLTHDRHGDCEEIGRQYTLLQEFLA